MNNAIEKQRWCAATRWLQVPSPEHGYTHRWYFCSRSSLTIPSRWDICWQQPISRDRGRPIWQLSPLYSRDPITTFSLPWSNCVNHRGHRKDPTVQSTWLMVPDKFNYRSYITILPRVLTKVYMLEKRFETKKIVAVAIRSLADKFARSFLVSSSSIITILRLFPWLPQTVTRLDESPADDT